jgi:hypothetical protein
MSAPDEIRTVAKVKIIHAWFHSLVLSARKTGRRSQPSRLAFYGIITLTQRFEELIVADL